MSSPERFFFPKECVIRKSGEFDRVFKGGTRFHGKGFSLIVLENSCGFSRLGISVHRRVKGAVKRNRIKRIIRESFRLQRKQYPAHSDIVFTVRPDFVLDSPGEITEKVVELIGQATVGR